jgi:hypothetical protein
MGALHHSDPDGYSVFRLITILPSPETLEAVEGYSLLRTDRNGWIELSKDGEQMWVEVARYYRVERKYFLGGEPLFPLCYPGVLTGVAAQLSSSPTLVAGEPSRRAKYGRNHHHPSGSQKSPPP